MSLLFDYEQLIDQIFKDEEYDEYNPDYGINDDLIDAIEDFLLKSWKEYVENNPGLFNPIFKYSEMKLFIFYEEIIGTYESRPIDECKILWGYDLGKAKPSSPIISEKEGSEFHSYEMKFPNNTGKVFIDFMESIKNTEASSADLEKCLTFGPGARIGRS